MARRHRSEIVIYVMDKNDLIRFFAYDILLSSALYAGLKRFHLPEWIPFAGSMFVPTLLRKTLHRRRPARESLRRQRQPLPNAQYEP